jgi:hypothetical protein
MSTSAEIMTQELDRLRPEMLERLERAGYRHVSDFGRTLERAGVISSETVRRAFGGSGGYPKLQVENLIKIFDGLNYSAVEIGAILKRMGCDLWPRLLHSTVSQRNETWLAIIGKVEACSDEAKAQLIAILRLIAKAEGLDINKELEEVG